MKFHGTSIIFDTGTGQNLNPNIYVVLLTDSLQSLPRDQVGEVPFVHNKSAAARFPVWHLLDKTAAKRPMTGN